MNRREMFASMIGSVVAGAVTTREVPAEPMPLLLAVEIDKDIAQLDPNQIAALRQSIEALYKGRDHPPIVILPPGLHIKGVYANPEDLIAAGEGK